jgi:carbon monoxide dehydrogenase subunit G
MTENAMARYRATLDIQHRREDVFGYLSDFSTTQEWDPGVVESERLGGDPIGPGTEFRVVAKFLGKKTPLTYRIVEYDPPHAVTFLGENATVVSHDTIAFEATGTGTRITYDAKLTLKGKLRLGDPILGLLFNRVGDRALAGLRRTLDDQRSQHLRPITGRALNGGVHAIPDDLSKPYSFLIVAFRREHQQLVDGWLPWLTGLERDRSDVAVYELAVLPSRYGPFRQVIDGGMTHGVPDPAARARTLTFYTDVQAVLADLGLVGTDTIAVAVVEPGGRILACETGGFSELKARWLARALAPPERHRTRASIA